MSRICFICNKGILVGRKVSHANNRSPKVSWPNLQNTKIKVNGSVMRANVCTRCLRSGRVQKAV